MTDALVSDDADDFTSVGGTLAVATTSADFVGKSSTNAPIGSDSAGIVNSTDTTARNTSRDGGLFSVRCLMRKPLAVVHAEEEEGVLERTLGYWDLFALGFGGTIGR